MSTTSPQRFIAKTLFARAWFVKTLARCSAITLTAALIGCAGEPTIQSGDDAEVIMGSLNKVDNSRMGLAYVDPEGDYGRYTRVYVAPLDLDNVEIVQPNSNSTSMVNRYNQEWELTDKNREDLQAAYREAMEQELTRGGAFEIADTGGWPEVPEGPVLADFIHYALGTRFKS